MEYKEVFLVLGAFIDNKLGWKAHINKVYKKHSGMIAMLRNAGFLPARSLEEIYFKTVIPKVTHGMLVWGTWKQNGFDKIEMQYEMAAKLRRNIPKTAETDRVLDRVGLNPIIHIYKRKVAYEMKQLQSTKREI